MKKVILARPNVLIIREMKKFLERNELTPQPVQLIQELDKISTQEVEGVVISTTVASSVEDTYVSVFKKTYQKFKNVPTIFATLAEVDAMAREIERELTPIIGRKPKIIALCESTENIPTYISSESLLVVHKNILNHPTKSPALDRLVAKFFKAGSIRNMEKAL